ncbi:MAG: VOC family protein [Sandarakinorhabdus sp.]
MELDVRANAIRRALERHRAGLADARGRVATVFVPATGVSRVTVARAAERYLAIGRESGVLEDGAVVWGTGWTAPMLGTGPAYDGQAATAGNGTMIAIVLDSRAKVDTMHAAALAAGGLDEGAPGVRGEEGPLAFYGAYFRDPDGNKLCAYRVGPA